MNESERIELERDKLQLEQEKINAQYAGALAELELEERNLGLEAAKLNLENAKLQLEREKAPHMFMGCTVKPEGDEYVCYIEGEDSYLEILKAKGTTPEKACKAFDRMWRRG